MTDFDSPWKEALDLYFEPFLALLFPEAHAGIDWSRGYESLDKELQQITPAGETGRRVVDKLVKVWRVSGEEEWVLIHVEIQSQRESGFARRVYVYNYRIADHYDRNVVSFAVLGDDRPGWRPDHFSYNLWGCTLSFRFPVVKLLDLAAHEAALERSTNPIAAVIQAHLRTLATAGDDERRRVEKFGTIRSLYARFGREDVRRLFRIIDWLMEVPPEINRQVLSEIRAFEQEKQMPFIDIAERIGMEKGLEKGLEKGRAEGLAEGIEWLLKVKFGPSGLELMPDIRKVSDPEQLRTIARLIESDATVEDIRRTLPA